MDLDRSRLEEEFESIMSAVALKPLSKKLKTMKKISLKLNSAEKVYQKCFEISQLIPQTTAEFFFMPENQIEFEQQMDEIKYFVETSLSREDKKDHLLSRKQDTYLNIIRDLITQSGIKEQIVQEVIEKSNIFNNPDFGKLEFKINSILELSRKKKSYQEIPHTISK